MDDMTALGKGDKHRVKPVLQRGRSRSFISPEETNKGRKNFEEICWYTIFSLKSMILCKNISSAKARMASRTLIRDFKIRSCSLDLADTFSMKKKKTPSQ